MKIKMKIKITIIILFLGLSSVAQIKFEKGYFVSNKGKKITCLIKNDSWNTSDGSFEYKLTNNSNVINVSFIDINEITIYNKSKYKRHNVDIDVNIINDIDNLSTDRSIKFEYKSILLKILISGDATLYVNQIGKTTRFFYTNINSITPKQLIFKKYTNLDGVIKNYDNYKQELLSNLSCENTSEKSIERITYEEGSLLSYFKKYNDCKNSDYIIYDEFSDIKKLFFKVKTGMSYASLIIDRVGFNNFDYSYKIKYDSKVIPTFGFEIEYFLPFKGNKLSLNLDPKYKSFSGIINTQTSNNGNREDVEVKYSSIEIPINLRYYKYLNSGGAVTFNLGVFFSNNLDSSIEFETSGGAEFDSLKEVETTFTPIFGIGYQINKYSLELKYSNRNILYSSSIFTSEYSNLDLTLGYTLF